MSQISKLLRERFTLEDDKANEEDVLNSIRRGVEFKGSNLWVLIFAIFIASLGLNTNSTAVIIGAMLISPIMGPIMGIGVGLGINDLPFLRRSAKNLAVATFFSIATSALYFYVSPMHEARSELLARTTPTTWDVLIAFFGGLAGMVAGTRREKGNVVAGVAIATALMPPLCTVGFGLANQNWLFALGAFYLYFINSVFICLGTLIIVRFMKFKHLHDKDLKQEKRNRYIIMAIVAVALLPSIYLTYEIVQRNVFEAATQRFISKEWKLDGVQVVRQVPVCNHGKKDLTLTVIGRTIDSTEVDTLRARMKTYSGMANARLHVRQGFSTGEPLSLDEIKQALLGELTLTRARQDSLRKPQPALPLLAEAKIWKPQLTALTYHDVYYDLSKSKPDTFLLATLAARPNLTTLEERQMRQWLSMRLHRDSVLLAIPPEPQVQGANRVESKQRKLNKRRKH